MILQRFLSVPHSLIPVEAPIPTATWNVSYFSGISAWLRPWKMHRYRQDMCRVLLTLDFTTTAGGIADLNKNPGVGSIGSLGWCLMPRNSITFCHKNQKNISTCLRCLPESWVWPRVSLSTLPRNFAKLGFSNGHPEFLVSRGPGIMHQANMVWVRRQVRHPLAMLNFVGSWVNSRPRRSKNEEHKWKDLPGKHGVL